MPLDPTTQAVLDAMNEAGLGDFAGQSPEEVRRASAERPPLPPGPDVQVENRQVPGADGPIDARIYRPLGADGVLPALVYAHGGGFVLGDLDGHDAVCRQLTVDVGCCVISLDYRLAPEAKFPAAPEDCYAATCFVHSHAAELGIDPVRIAVGGDSAGANLSTVVATLARDRGGPALAFQLLLYPGTDWRTLDTPSYRDNAQGYFLTLEGVQWFREHYLRDEADRHDPMASPLANDNLAGLPPALVITAECDPLRDEGDAYGRALQAAGVETTVTRYDSTIHGFVSLYAFIAQGREALAESAGALRKAFAG